VAGPTNCVAAALRAHLHHLFGALNGLPRHLAIGEVHGEGLLDVHIFAGGDGVGEDPRVGHIGRGDEDGVHVLHSQQFPIPGGLLWRGSEGSCDVGCPLSAIDLPDVANGDDGGVLAGLNHRAEVVL
jgi:hypothetical protein